MAALLICGWLTVFVVMIRAVILKDILWPQKQEDREEGGWKAQRDEIQACDPRDCTPQRSRTQRSGTINSRFSGRSTGTGITRAGSGGILGGRGDISEREQANGGGEGTGPRRRLPGSDEPNLDMDESEKQAEEETAREDVEIERVDSDPFATPPLQVEQLMEHPIRPKPQRARTSSDIV